jgi:hypothetical protein
MLVIKIFFVIMQGCLPATFQGYNMTLNGSTTPGYVSGNVDSYSLGDGAEGCDLTINNMTPGIVTSITVTWNGVSTTVSFYPPEQGSTKGTFSYSGVATALVPEKNDTFTLEVQSGQTITMRCLEVTSE